MLIEADADGIEDAIDRAQRAMDRASELVLYGFRLRTDAEVIAWPERYRDGRGAAFFDGLMDRLAERQGSERRARQWTYW